MSLATTQFGTRGYNNISWIANDVSKIISNIAKKIFSTWMRINKLDNSKNSQKTISKNKQII